MNKLFYKGMVEDIQNEKCTDAEIEALLAAFDYTVKRTATTLARKAWFALEDYATSMEGVLLFYQHLLAIQLCRSELGQSNLLYLSIAGYLRCWIFLPQLPLKY